MCILHTTKAKAFIFLMIVVVNLQQLSLHAIIRELSFMDLKSSRIVVVTIASSLAILMTVFNIMNRVYLKALTPLLFPGFMDSLLLSHF